MIASILSFGLKSMICSGIFVGYYLLALKNAQMHGFNRIYLLTAALLSLVLPFVHFDVMNVAPAALADFPLLGVTAKGADEVVANMAASKHVFNWQMLAIIAYYAVAVFMILKLAAKFAWAYRLKRKGLQEQNEGFVLIKTDDPRAPFSFMNMLFWPKHMRQDSVEGRGILMHELAHIEQRHTLDKILTELIIAACWINPFNWLIKKELWLQHEFLADSHAIKDRDSDTFARMLLYGVTNSFDRSIINPFFQSPVKRRLLMLTQQGKNSYGHLRRLLCIPILCTAVLLLSAYTKDKALNKVSRAAKKVVVVLDAAHGGEDVGGKGADGSQEKDITLALCKRLTALSAEYNIEIVSTRTDDVKATLEERLEKSNNTNAAMFISVHVKKSTEGEVADNSYELGVSKRNKNYDNSILLASAIANKLKGQKLLVKVVDHDGAYMIRGNAHPALLLECGSMDDVDNMALLQNDARSEELCRNILSGIVDYNSKQANK